MLTWQKNQDKQKKLAWQKKTINKNNAHMAAASEFGRLAKAAK
jgi:hypothetical protein